MAPTVQTFFPMIFTGCGSSPRPTARLILFSRIGFTRFQPGAHGFYSRRFIVLSQVSLS